MVAAVLGQILRWFCIYHLRKELLFFIIFLQVHLFLGRIWNSNTIVFWPLFLEIHTIFKLFLILMSSIHQELWIRHRLGPHTLKFLIEIHLVDGFALWWAEVIPRDGSQDTPAGGVQPINWTTLIDSSVLSFSSQAMLPLFWIQFIKLVWSTVIHYLLHLPCKYFICQQRLRLFFLSRFRPAGSMIWISWSFLQSSSCCYSITRGGGFCHFLVQRRNWLFLIHVFLILFSRIIISYILV